MKNTLSFDAYCVDGIHILDSTGRTVARMICGDELAFTEQLQWAKRIVESVNEFKGLDTEQIEDGAFSKMREDRDLLLQ
jgi:hypothetical protein